MTVSTKSVEDVMKNIIPHRIEVPGSLRKYVSNYCKPPKNEGWHKEPVFNSVISTKASYYSWLRGRQQEKLKSINVVINNKGENCYVFDEDSPYIRLSNTMLENKEGFNNLPFLVDATLGVLEHEFCHVLYTDTKKYFEKIFKPIQEGKFGAKERLFKTRFANMFEDVSIENTHAKLRPSDFFLVAQQRALQRINSRIPPKDFKGPFSFVDVMQQLTKEQSIESGEYYRFIDNFFFNLCYGKITQEEFDKALEYEPILEEAVNIFENSTPENTSQVLHTVDVFWDLFKDNLVDSQEEDVQKMFEDLLKDLIEEVENGDLTIMVKIKHDNKSPNYDSAPVSNSKELAQLFGNEANDVEDDVGCVFIDPANSGIDFVRSFSCIYGTKIEDKIEVDPSLVQEMSDAISIRSRHFSDYSRGELDGKVTQHSFLPYLSGSDNIYTKVTEHDTKSFFVGVLVDQSGSMHGSEIIAARRICALLHRAFDGNQHAELFIYGHNDLNLTDKKYGCTIMTYKEPGMDFIEVEEAIECMIANYANRDGSAILATAKRIREHTDRKGVLIVISDGAPASVNYLGESAENHTRDKVIECKEVFGVDVIQVGINESVPSEKMFEHFVTFTDIEKLPQMLGDKIVELADNYI